MTPDIVVRLIDDLIALFDPVVEAVESTSSAEALLKDMGYASPSDTRIFAEFEALFGTLVQLLDEADDGIRGDTAPDYLGLFRNLIAAIQDVVHLIRDVGTTLRTSFSTDFLAATNIVEQFPRQLADYLLVKMLARRYPVLHAVLLMSGIIDQTYVTAAATPFNTPYMRRVIRWERLGDYFSTPIAAVQEAYGWNTANFDYERLVENLHHFGQSVRLFVCLADPDPDTLQALNAGEDAITEENADKLRILKIPLLPVVDAGIGAEIYPVLNPAKDKTAGIGIGLYFDPSGGLTYPLTDELSLSVGYTGSAPLDAGLLLLPGQALRTVSNVFGGSGPQADLSEFVPEFAYAGSDQNTLLFETGFGAKFEFAAWALRAGVLADLAGVYVETDLKGAVLTLRAGQDGFLSQVLPAQPMTLGFDLTVGFSSKRGLYFGGSADLEVRLPLQLTAGPVTVQAITIALKPVDDTIPLNLGADISFKLGPLQAVAQNMGAAVVFSFPANRDGNLGPLQVDLSFKAPDGVGLSVDAAGVSGGGFLAHANDQYSGVLQLKFNDLALQAFGLITTQVAGADGYSLIALIDSNFPPVQLGWGFTLDGVGGLLAVHRTAAVAALRAAVKGGKISSILFPTVAISNASQVLSVLDTFFPTAPGRFLFGPMALIEWGTPAVLTASVAVVLELPEPIEIILLAKIEAKLPTPSSALVHLNMDALGVLDLTQGELSLDASLFDSKLISFAITGDMALRADWSSQREFLLAIGGFHPQFTPPAGFPSLNRITINMPSGIVSKLRLAAYLAITSNSLQFGATLDVYIGVSGCGISGHLGFDALLQLDPFQFSADISGSVAVTVSGDDLASVSLDATLTGPAPWHIAGSFKIHVIFWDIGISFSASWGLDAPSQPVSTIDVGALLNAALADPRNWNSQLPLGVAALTSTRQVSDPNAIFAHPLAMLEVHEQVVPLDLAITRFGQAVPSGASEFSITGFNVGGQTITYTAVQDAFAPAQFFDLSDNDKLSRPSFERHDAGAVMSGNLLINGASRAKTIDYETYYINTPGVVTVDEGVPQSFPWSGLQFVMSTGAAARKIISRSGSQRYAAPGNPIKVQEPIFVVAGTANLTTAFAPAAAGPTYSDAAAALKSVAPAQRASLQILGAHELAVAA